MNVYVSDVQAVPEIEGTLFSMLQQGAVSALIVLKNTGTNTINYRFQQFDGTQWTNMGASGTDYYNTLVAAQVKFINLSATYPQVRLVGNASGTSVLDFSLTRYFTRPDGGQVPILNL